MPATSRIIIQRQSGEVVAQFSLGPGEHSVGRDTANAVSAESDCLSRHHAKLILSPNGISIEDLGSTHGTFVDGVAVQGTTQINLNQAVQIGDLYLTVQEDSPGDSQPDLYSTGDMIGGGRYTLRQEEGQWRFSQFPWPMFNCGPIKIPAPAPAVVEPTPAPTLQVKQ